MKIGQEDCELLGIDILRAIDLANLIRVPNGHEPIDDLIPGIPGKPNVCVLANTFNCDCVITGYHSWKEITDLVHEDSPYFDENYQTEFLIEYDDYENVWYAVFKEKKYAKALSDELNTRVVKVTRRSIMSENLPNIGFAVLLPRSVGQIASSFDSHELMSYELPDER